MTVRRPGSWQRLLALAPLLLVVVSLPTQLVLRCRMDGQVRDTCCCPVDRTQDGPADPALVVPECCDREVATRSFPTVRTVPETTLPPVVVTSIVLPDPAARGPSAPRQLRERSPARGGPLILLLKQTFLI
jgi:hypothetical protein